MDVKNNPSKAENPQRRSSYFNDELPYFYSQDSDVIFQIDSSKNRHGAENSFSEGEVFDFDMISAAENLDFLFEKSLWRNGIKGILFSGRRRI